MNIMLDKHAVARAFSRAASDYERLAGVQRRIGHDLLAFMPNNSIESDGIILDLGSGTGFIAQELENRMQLPIHNLVELDIAAGMLEESRRRAMLNRWQIQADIDSLPLAPGSVQKIISNLSFQWCKSPESLVESLSYILSSAGSLVFSVVTEGSVEEIRRAWQMTNGGGHVNAFSSELAYIAALEGSGFDIIDAKVAQYTDRFSSVAEMLESVRGIGAGNHLTNRQPGLLGKNKYRKWLAELSRQSIGKNGFELTYKILFVCAQMRAIP